MRLLLNEGESLSGENTDLNAEIGLHGLKKIAVRDFQCPDLYHSIYFRSETEAN